MLFKEQMNGKVTHVRDTHGCSDPNRSPQWLVSRDDPQGSGHLELQRADGGGFPAWLRAQGKKHFALLPLCWSELSKDPISLSPGPKYLQAGRS